MLRWPGRLRPGREHQGRSHQQARPKLNGSGACYKWQPDVVRIAYPSWRNIADSYTTAYPYLIFCRLLWIRWSQ
jgi:hypothetical protein